MLHFKQLLFLKFYYFYNFLERYRKQYDDIGYHDIVTIPSGTRNIKIYELSTSQNYLGELIVKKILFN